VISPRRGKKKRRGEAISTAIRLGLRPVLGEMTAAPWLLGDKATTKVVDLSISTPRSLYFLCPSCDLRAAHSGSVVVVVIVIVVVVVVVVTTAAVVVVVVWQSLKAFEAKRRARSVHSSRALFNEYLSLSFFFCTQAAVGRRRGCTRASERERAHAPCWSCAYIYIYICIYVFAYVCVCRKAGRGVLQAGFTNQRVSRGGESTWKERGRWWP
jgi:hypothetical protein